MVGGENHMVGRFDSGGFAGAGQSFLLGAQGGGIRARGKKYSPLSTVEDREKRKRLEKF